MKKVFLLILLIFYSPCFCLFATAQRGQQEGQNKPAPSLPNPTIKATNPAEIEAPRLRPIPRMVSFRCMGESLILGDIVIWANKSYEVVKQEPEIGVKAKEYPARSRPDYGFGSTSSHELWTGYRIIYNDIRYDVALNRESIIRRINTNDSKFKTPEGISVGDSLQRALKASKSKPVGVETCLYRLKLESGWNAVFFESDILKDGALSPDARVASFFKEN